MVRWIVKTALETTVSIRTLDRPVSPQFHVGRFKRLLFTETSTCLTTDSVVDFFAAKQPKTSIGETCKHERFSKGLRLSLIGKYQEI
jgi:hypothetical protein